MTQIDRRRLLQGFGLGGLTLLGACAETQQVASEVGSAASSAASGVSRAAGSVVSGVGDATGNRLGVDAIAGKTPSGSLTLTAGQAAFIGSGTAGKGNLRFRGRNYPFAVGGLGLGGIGASSIEANGQVYNLTNISQFPGTYAQVRYGGAVGTASTGELWLQNDAGVILRLMAKRTGLMLSLGADAIVISLNN